MSDHQRSEHRNLIEAFGVIAAAQPNGVVRRVDGVVTIASGLPMSLFNQIFIESEPESASATAVADAASPTAVAEAVALLRERGAPWVLTLAQGLDDRFVTDAADLGLVLDPGEGFPGMAVSPLPAPEPEPAGLEIRQVAGASLPDHASVVERGFGLDRAIIDAVMSDAIAADPRFAYYVGYVDGVAAVSGLGVRTGDTIGVFNIATLEEARRRGYGAAITRRILSDGALLGCTIGTLQSSDMGRPVYEAIGFRTVATYVGYVDPRQLGSGAHG